MAATLITIGSRKSTLVRSTCSIVIFVLGDANAVAWPLDWIRIGAFLLDSPVVLLTENLTLPKMLPRPEDDPAKTIQTTGTCLLAGARTGIWIAGNPVGYR